MSLCTVAFLAPAAFAQTLFKCVQNGKTVYQAEACPETARQDTLKAQTAPAGVGAAGQPDVENALHVMSSYRACADVMVSWAGEISAPYEQWKSRNAHLVARVEGDRQLNARYQEQVKIKRGGNVGICREVALFLRGQAK